MGVFKFWLYNKYWGIIKLLDLKGLYVTKFEKSSNGEANIFYVKTKLKYGICLDCGKKTSHVDDKRIQKVKYFVCDMWKPCVNIAKNFFPEATIIIDKYHYVRQVIEPEKYFLKIGFLICLKDLYNKSTADEIIFLIEDIV